MFVQIVDDVRAWFQARGIDARVDEGAEARAAQSNFGPGSANRVVFTPADDPLEIFAPTHVGEDDERPRQLINPIFVFEVAFAGYDARNASRDLCHRRVCFDLWEATVQATQRAYYGAHEWRGARWSKEKKHIVHGAELLATLAINVPLFDAPVRTATPRPIPGAPKPAEV